jgi:hypothetical protein
MTFVKTTVQGLSVFVKTTVQGLSVFVKTTVQGLSVFVIKQGSHVLHSSGLAAQC